MKKGMNVFYIKFHFIVNIVGLFSEGKQFALAALTTY